MREKALECSDAYASPKVIAPMGHRDLFASQFNVFSGIQTSFEKADFTVLGVPFDVTSTFRTGARFGPTAIRQASLNIETYSFRTGLDVEDLKIHDLGDLHISTDTETTLKHLELVTAEILKENKIPVTIGGEHTITLGVARGLRKKAKDTAVVSFDAHLDLRNEFLGLNLSHTTFMRRINEQVKPRKIIEVGTRAVCKEEILYAKKAGVHYFPANQIKGHGRETIKKLHHELDDVKHVYVSVDMDVLDPAYVPAAQNPEPDGLETSMLLDMLGAVCDSRVVGFDVLEVSPTYDQGLSAVQAAKVIFEILCFLEKSRKNNPE